MKIYNLEEIEKQLNKPWSPVDVAKFNGQVVRAAIFKGEYRWHAHQDEDEFFFVYKGKITIETRSGNITLSAGQGTVVPKGMQHRPTAKERSLVLMVEPEGLKSKGNS